MKSGASYLALKNALRDLDRPTSKRWVYSALRHMVADPELGPKALGLVVKAARLCRDASSHSHWLRPLCLPPRRFGCRPLRPALRRQSSAAPLGG